MTDLRDALARFHEGRHHRLWELLGAHPLADGAGTRVRVWAPNARSISVVGTWNEWTDGVDPMQRIDGSGVWETTVDGAEVGHLYKLAVVGADGATTCHADPMAMRAEVRGNASEVFSSRYAWGDDEWMEARPSVDAASMRLSAYEVHLGSWRRHPDGGPLSYREVAPLLADHMVELGFTHVELLPVAEHPYEPSWGYQVTGYFAPTSRFGSPDDFRWFVDHLHQRGIGVLVDWVPAHFPKDEWALARFDGTPLYEHTDPRRAEHPDWGTLEFDVTRPEVRSFLIANALFWLEELHVDGLRVDAVASMLYLDYSRGPGEWTPNADGGNEDLDAVAFLCELNTVVQREAPGALVIAEESTAWEGVSRPAETGGLGFTHKWNMGWMHDTLGYWSTPPADRRWHHEQLSFGLTYAWAEHFVLPLSHDEVVHLKQPLLLKSSSDDDGERFADLRSLLAWMWAHPGKQLLFMGAEMAEDREWSQDRELDWARLDQPLPAGVAALIASLNAEQAARPALFAGDGDASGFAWLSVDDAQARTFAFERSVPGLPDEVVVVVANLSDEDRPHYRVGLDGGGSWDTILTTDHVRFGGATASPNALMLEPTPWQGRSHSAVLALPARSVMYLGPRHE